MQILFFLFGKHLDKTVLAIAIASSVFLITRNEESRFNTARAVSAFLLYPVNRVEAYFTSKEELQRENEKLRELVATFYHERERYLQFGEERNRLRRLIGFRQDSFCEFLPCEVIARSSNRFHHSVTVDRGIGDGVRAGMSVVGYRGIVGRVIQTFPSSSRVILLNNKSISVSCIDKRSRIIGILEWERENLFRLEYVGKEEDVAKGDTLLTSGLGRLFPKGFPVGTVFQVTEERGGLSRKVGVVSMIDLNTIEELFIVIAGRDWNSDEVLDEIDKLGIGKR